MATMTIDFDQDALLIKVPKEGGPCEITLPASRAGERGEVMFLTPQQTAKILDATLHEGQESAGKWIDLLGVGNPGLAVEIRRSTIRLVIAFGERRKTLHMTGFGPPDFDQYVNWDADFLLPPTVWAIEFQKEEMGGHLMRSALFCGETKIGAMSDPAPLVGWPFGNADPRICWGSVSVAHLRVTDPLAVDNLFFSSRFNGDLLRLDFLRPDGRGIESTVDWFRSLHRFPNQRFKITGGQSLERKLRGVWTD